MELYALLTFSIFILQLTLLFESVLQNLSSILRFCYAHLLCFVSGQMECNFTCHALENYAVLQVFASILVVSALFFRSYKLYVLQLNLVQFLQLKFLFAVIPVRNFTSFSVTINFHGFSSLLCTFFCFSSNQAGESCLIYCARLLNLV